MNYEILCERHSPSDEQIICVSIFKKNGEFVKSGDLIFELEGAKAIFEVESPQDGFFTSYVQEGATLEIGQVIGVVSETIESIKVAEIKNELKLEASPNHNGRISFTNPAQKIFAELETDLQSQIKRELRELKTYNSEDLHRTLAKLAKSPVRSAEINKEAWVQQINKFRGETKVILIGGGFGSFQAMDLLLQQSKYEVIGYFSDEVENLVDQIDIPHLGKCSEDGIQVAIRKYANPSFVISVGVSPSFRLKMYTLLKKLGADLPSLIDQSTVISRNTVIGDGNLIFANSFVGVDTRIGDANFISSNAVIEHHNIIGNANCFGPSLSTSGVVTIGNGCRFGAGVVIEPNINVGDSAVVASHATITNDVLAGTVLKVRA